MIQFRTRASLTILFLALTYSPATVFAGVGPDENSHASSATGCIEIAPDGSGPTLESLGLTVTLQILDASVTPVAGYPAQDIWLGDAVGGTRLQLCEARLVASVDSDADGWTTITGSLVGGGSCDAGLQVYLSGVPLFNSAPLDIDVVSADLDGDLDVDTMDLAAVPGGFAHLFLNQDYDHAVDFDCDGREDLLDLVRFAELFLSEASCP